MGKVLEFRAADSQKLLRAMKAAKDKRVFVRLSAVYQAVQGQRIRDIAQTFSMSVRSVYYWVGIYLRDHDPAGLAEAPRSGRPPTAPALKDERILNALKLDPRTLGYRQNAWTVATLAHYLNARYDTAITEPTLRRRMRAMGLRYKRPKYVYEEKEPSRAQKKGRSSESCA